MLLIIYYAQNYASIICQGLSELLLVNKPRRLYTRFPFHGIAFVQEVGVTGTCISSAMLKVSKFAHFFNILRGIASGQFL